MKTSRVTNYFDIIIIDEGCNSSRWFGGPIAKFMSREDFNSSENDLMFTMLLITDDKDSDLAIKYGYHCKALSVYTPDDFTLCRLNPYPSLTAHNLYVALTTGVINESFISVIKSNGAYLNDYLIALTRTEEPTEKFVTIRVLDDGTCMVARNNYVLGDVHDVIKKVTHNAAETLNGWYEASLTPKQSLPKTVTKSTRWIDYLVNVKTGKGLSKLLAA